MTNTAIRWSGLLLIVGTALFVTAIFISSSTQSTTQQLPLLTNALLFSSSIMLLLSLPAMYARQADAAGRCDAIVNMAATGTIPFLFVARSSAYQILGITGYNPANCPGGTNPPLPSVGTAGSDVTLSAVFDGWGYVHLFDAVTLQELDTYAVPEGLDEAYATGFGNLTVHEVVTDIDSNLAYLSYYDAGLRVIKFDASGIQEVGHFIDTNRNDFWGVQVFWLPADPTEQSYISCRKRSG